MKGYLIRVGIDQTKKSGGFNAPVDPETGKLAYVPIKETIPSRPENLTTNYRDFIQPCRVLGKELPASLWQERTHLNPDFSKLTYGDINGNDVGLENQKPNRRGKPLKDLEENDFLVFYAGWEQTKHLPDHAGYKDKLAYAIIGFYRVKEKPMSAQEFVREGFADCNAHTRCEYNDAAIIISAKEGESGRLISGRLSKCIPIGEFRDKAYRVTKGLLLIWGGFSNNPTGYLQRSIILPKFAEPERFLDWFYKQLAERQIVFIKENN